MYYDQSILDVLDLNYRPIPTYSFKILCRIGVLCSRAEYHADDMDLPPENRRILGDASEQAVFKLMETMVGNIYDRRNKNPKVSSRKCVQGEKKNVYWCYISQKFFGSFFFIIDM